MESLFVSRKVIDNQYLSFPVFAKIQLLISFHSCGDPLFVLSSLLLLQQWFKMKSLAVWIYIWVFNSIPLINMPVFMLISCCFYYNISVVKLEIRNCETRRRSFIIQNHFSSSVFIDFCFHMKLRIVFQNL